eukprot:2899988-Rhodomonas_salina.1
MRPAQAVLAGVAAMLHSSLTSGHSIAELAGCRLEEGGAEDADLGRGVLESLLARATQERA